MRSGWWPTVDVEPHSYVMASISVCICLYILTRERACLLHAYAANDDICEWMFGSCPSWYTRTYAQSPRVRCRYTQELFFFLALVFFFLHLFKFTLDFESCFCCIFSSSASVNFWWTSACFICMDGYKKDLFFSFAERTKHHFQVIFGWASMAGAQSHYFPDLFSRQRHTGKYSTFLLCAGAIVEYSRGLRVIEKIDIVRKKTEIDRRAKDDDCHILHHQWL